MKIRKIGVLLIFSVIIITFQPDALAKRYVADSTSQSTNWDRAEWSNYPSTPPRCTPCTPVTAMRMVRAGDTVYFRGGQGGSYNLKPNPNYIIPALHPAQSGTADKPIRFVNFPKERPHLRNPLSYPETGYWHPLIGATKREWIVWKGFDLSAEDSTAKVRFYASKHCTLEDCKIEGKAVPAKKRRLTNYSAISIGASSDFITIKNCLIRGVHGTDGVNGSGIKLYSGYHTTVENCTFLENDYAIHDKNDGRHNVYKRNFIRSNVMGIEIGAMAGKHAEDIEVSNNIILTSSPSGKGISIISSLPATVDAVRGFKCYNNVINSNGSTAIYCRSAFSLEYYNNIIVNSSEVLKQIDDKGSIVYWDYNAYWGNPRFIMRIGSANKSDHTTLEAWQRSRELSGGEHPDAHSFSADPLFFNSSGNQPLDYRLKKNSPCIGTGKRGVNMGPLLPHTVGKTSFVSNEPGKPSTPTGLRVVE